MRYFVILKAAFRALRRNKMRTILTMLGIIIGVGAVIAMVGIGNGAKAQVQARIAALGQNVIQVFSGSINRAGVRSGFGGAGTLTVDDGLAMAREVPGVVAVSPEVRTSQQTMYGNNNRYTSVMGESVDYLAIRQWDLADGVMFSDSDTRSAAKVCVLGKTVADNLFPEDDPIGKIIRIRNVPTKVLGVLKPKGASMFGSDQDERHPGALHHRHETLCRRDDAPLHQRAGGHRRGNARRPKRHRRFAPAAAPHPTGRG